MKKIILTIFFTALFSLYIFHAVNKKRTEIFIKKISSEKTIKFHVETILLSSKHKGITAHFTDLKNIIFRNKKYLITYGGITSLKTGKTNRYFNANLFKKITAINETVFIGYIDGFLTINGNYINHFIFNTPIEKCEGTKNNIYCIQKDKIIKKQNNKFILYYKAKDNLKDIALFKSNLYILSSKNLIIKNKYREKIINVKAEKIKKTQNRIFIVNDREIFELKGENLHSLIKLPGLTGILEYNGKLCFLTINGNIYDESSNLIKSLNSYVNGYAKIGNNYYIFTPKGVKSLKKNAYSFDIVPQNQTTKENYITKFTNYKNYTLIGYFNSGIDKLTRDLKLSPYIENLSGINDIYIQKDNLLIATTNGLFIYAGHNLKERYDFKSGIPGHNVSKITKYKNSVFISTEKGISKKSNDKFISINGLHGLINNRVNTMEIYGNNLYAGTLGGISVLNDLKIIKNLDNKNFKSRWITSLLTIKNKLYIATYGGGIYSYDGKSIKYLLNTTKRVFFNLNTLINHKNKFLLGGTLKKGIFIYNIKSGSGYFYDDLPSKNITALSIKNDNLFIGSDYGFWIMNINDIIR